MRVSKTVREYIEEQVEKAYPHEEKYYSDLQSEQQHKVDDWIEGKLNALIEEAEHLFGDLYEAGEGKKKFEFSIRTAWGVRLKSALKCDELKKKRKEKVNKKISEIILTLELGGNKADLDRMLAEIRAE